MCNICSTIENEAFKNITYHIYKHPIFTVTMIDDIIFLNSENFNYRFESISGYNPPILVVEKENKTYKFDDSNRNYSIYVAKLCNEVKNMDKSQTP